VRVIATFSGGPSSGMQLLLGGQSANQVFTVPDPWVPALLRLGCPVPWESLRQVTYVYARTVPAGGPARWLHLYVLDPADQDLTWGALHPAPAWALPDDPSRIAPRRTLGAPRKQRSSWYR
jgi:hypothetical protein